ncbi:hypothetical protein Avbf_02606 [Armadillidium vulgare]|nr:hypothetical protein Avbf_02606 [Armadillidium vulgare]
MVYSKILKRSRKIFCRYCEFVGLRLSVTVCLYCSI